MVSKPLIPQAHYEAVWTVLSHPHNYISGDYIYRTEKLMNTGHTDRHTSRGRVTPLSII